MYNPAIIGAAAVLGAGAASAISSNRAQRKANEANIEATKLANESNERINERQLAEAWNMARYQNEWNLAQWQRENEYNSPAQQMLRYRQAGINPYFTDLTNGNSRELQAASMSPPAQVPMEAAHVEPVSMDYSWIGNAVSSGVNAYYQNQLMQTQIDKGAADARIAQENANVQNLRNHHELIKIAADAKRSESERDLARSYLKVQQATEANQVYHSDLMNRISSRQVDELEAKIANMNIENQLLGIDAKYRAKMNDAQLAQYRANIAQAYASARAGDASAAASYAAAAVSNVQEAGISIDNKTKAAYNAAILDKVESEADKSYWQSQYEGKRYNEGNLSLGLPSKDKFGVERDYSKRPAVKRYNRKSHSKGGIR